MNELSKRKRDWLEEYGDITIEFENPGDDEVEGYDYDAEDGPCHIYFHPNYFEYTASQHSYEDNGMDKDEAIEAIYEGVKNILFEMCDEHR